MKHLAAIVACFVILTNFTQDIFKTNPPSVRPAIFTSSMPPCIVGVATQYGKYLKLKTKTLEQANGFIDMAHKQVPKFVEKVRDLEVKLIYASKEKRHKDFESLLKQLAKVKMEASLFHESIVIKARATFDKGDLKKIDEFITKNKDVFLETVRL